MRHDPLCTGSRKTATWETWNKKVAQVHRERMWRLELPQVIPNFCVADTVRKFLQCRTGPDGRPMADVLGEAEQFAGNWVRFRILLPEMDVQVTASNTCIALHGTRFECLYSILFGRQLLPSWSHELGQYFC